MVFICAVGPASPLALPSPTPKTQQKTVVRISLERMILIAHRTQVRGWTVNTSADVTNWELVPLTGKGF